MVTTAGRAQACERALIVAGLERGSGWRPRGLERGSEAPSMAMTTPRQKKRPARGAGVSPERGPESTRRRNPHDPERLARTTRRPIQARCRLPTSALGNEHDHELSARHPEHAQERCTARAVARPQAPGSRNQQATGEKRDERKDVR